MAEDNLAEVEVLGLTENVDDDFLQLYFENKRRSGGGPIQSFDRNGSVALITFSNPDDAGSVLSKEGHCLHHVAVEVRRPLPWDRRKVALSGLDPDTSETLLELYMESVSGQETLHIVCSADRSSALVTFKEELSVEDLNRLLSRVGEKTLHQRSICARRVRACADILVENISAQVPAELLEMYFESTRSGGGAVRSVTMLGNNTAAVVSFCDWNVTSQVLCRPHTLQNRQLQVSPYYPDLLGTLSDDSTAAEAMEEEEKPTTPVTVNMEENVGKDIGAPTEDREEPSIEDKDEKMVGVELYSNLGGTVGNVHFGEDVEVQPTAPEMPPTSPEMPPQGLEMPPTVPEMLHIRPHSPAQGSTVNNYNDLGSLRTLNPPDTRKSDEQGNRLYPLMLSSQEERREAATGGNSNSVHEAEVIMEAVELSFIQKYLHELLAGMDSVTIFPLDEADKFGFKVIGDTSSCKTAVELLQHIVSSLSSRTVTLEYPWVSYFLLQSEGQRILRDTEKQYQCIIDTSQISVKVLDCVHTDPWSFVLDTGATESSPVQSMITDDGPENLLVHADMDGIKRFASLLKSEEQKDISQCSSTTGLNVKDSLEEDLSEGSSKESDSTISEVKDEEMDKVCKMSRKEYQESQLDEEAQLLLAIQRSMDTQEDEEAELRRALEMSLIQHESEDTEESLQKALEMSLRDLRTHNYNIPMRMVEHSASFHETTSDLAQIRVLAGDETSMVVAGKALHKAITSKINTVSLEGTNGVQNISQILEAVEKKHKVKITKCGKKLEIQGFLQGPSQCRQEISEILNALQDRNQTKVMDLDIDRDVTMTVVPVTSEEYKDVVRPFLDTLLDLKSTIDVLQVQKVDNRLLYNQYQLKKLRMVTTDPNVPAERILYHGTTETSAREICHYGFNRSFCGKNATLYGKGVYFAANSDISTRYHYSPPNDEGKKFVLVARVLTGDYTQGKENMVTPPPMPDATGEVPRRYDSLVDNLKKPTIYVIFNDTQAYPEYLITCRDISRRKTAAK